jgi:hypothetical protein
MLFDDQAKWYQNGFLPAQKAKLDTTSVRFLIARDRTPILLCDAGVLRLDEERGQLFLNSVYFQQSDQFSEIRNRIQLEPYEPFPEALISLFHLSGRPD